MTFPDTTTTLPTIDDGGGARAGRRWWRMTERKRSLVAGLGSMFVHTCAILALGLSLAKPKSLHEGPGLQTFVDARVDPLQRPPPPEPPLDPPPDPNIEPVKIAATTAAQAGGSSAVKVPAVAPPKPAVASAKAVALKATQLDADLMAPAPLLSGLEPGKHKPSLSATRSQGQRAQAVIYRGGSAESEKAVERSLAWFLKHQNSDGSWSFDHRTCGECNGRCSHPGTMGSARIAATSMALLPFLAAGETHKQGKHRRHVDQGLKFLVRSMQQTPQGGMFSAGGGNMYAHSLATIVLCEALAMTRDRDLIAPAKAATAYILASQDLRGGGWRYFPGQPGDTSVTGWALNALKSADNAYQPVPTPSIDGVRAFLDYVQQDEGAAYGYADPDLGTVSTTAVGLLCRMQLGWKRNEPALIRGVSELSARGPAPNNMYYNFYATQVLHHFGGPSWDQWNKQMRDHLVRTQATTGHEAGSWYFEESNPHDQLASAVGGRLYNTSLATLTLEVYYRHLPLYGSRFFDEAMQAEADAKKPEPAATPIPAPTATGTATPAPSATATPVPSATPIAPPAPSATAVPSPTAGGKP